jgi:hypothetical protein
MNVFSRLVDGGGLNADTWCLVRFSFNSMGFALFGKFAQVNAHFYLGGLLRCLGDDGYLDGEVVGYGEGVCEVWRGDAEIAHL